MKHSTFRKSSLISSVALLLVAIVALSGATFAWFSTASLATATGIKASTSQGSNLTISKAKNTGFTQDLVLTKDDGVQKEMSPVTTDDLTTRWTAKAEKYNSQEAEDGIYTEDATGKNYIKKTIYVKFDAPEGTAEAPNTHDLKLNVVPTPAKDANQKDIGSLKYYRVAVAPTAADADLTTLTGFTTKYFADNITDQYPDSAKHADYTAQEFGEIDLGTIDANDVYGFDVFVWFEGEDKDCKDTDAVNNIDLVLEFK